MSESGGIDAEKVDIVHGGLRGSRTDFLWRCRTCGGHFVAPEPTGSVATIFVGLTPARDSEAEEILDRLRERRAVELIREARCVCGLAEKWRSR